MSGVAVRCIFEVISQEDGLRSLSKINLKISLVIFGSL